MNRSHSIATRAGIGALLLLLGSCRAGGARDATTVREPVPFDAVFTGGTLRVDCHHVGTAGEQHLAVAGVRAEGAWPGSRTQLVDDTDMGLYRFEVRSAADGRVLFSRGFCSIFGEWKSTAAAKAGWASFEESQRFPEPRAPVELVWHEHQDDGSWKEVARASVDPASRFVDRAPLATDAEVIPVFEHGEPAAKCDLLVVADGYPVAERAKFEAGARKLVDVMFATEPFRRRRGDFNVRLLYTPAAEAGLSNPRKNAWRRSRFGLSFNSFDVDRYVLAMHDRELREACAQAPYDALILLCNERKYGGGGIYNLWATATADSEAAPYLFVHEFGHSFSGLADEYYTSTVAYAELTPPGTEPWEPNVTALLDPENLKWKDLVAPGTALPTAWDKAAYDEADLVYQAKRKALIDAQASEDENEALMREVKLSSSAFLQAQPNYGKVGAFEGAAYLSRGMYRAEVDCIMFTRNPTSFCKVCERAVDRTIDRFAR